ncbi:MAG: lamin tail domain-containing protein [Bacteroidales bacterium]|nr:lamin tail domain-containing protein [Bacteroidales bacterium]
MRRLIILLLILFPIHHALSQERGVVLISEILFNPPLGGSDYVELYNPGSDAVDISQLRLASMKGDSIVKLFAIADRGLLMPHDYLVVTTDAAFVSGNYTVRYPSKMIEVSKMPSYNDASGIVMVCTIDSTVLDRFDYNEKMHSRLLRDREGVALERRSFDAPTQEASNWYSAASTDGYGTPTYANSQSYEFLFLNGSFHIEEPLFSPDGDGYNDLLDISFSLENCDMSANIFIYDAMGRPIRYLSRGVLLGCSGVVTWDGIDESGRPVPRGKYVVVIEAYNESGAKQSWRRTVSVVRK